MTFYRIMIIVWTNKLYCSQYMRLNRLIETIRYTLPKVVLEGFLIFILSKTAYSQSLYI